MRKNWLIILLLGLVFCLPAYTSAGTNIVKEVNSCYKKGVKYAKDGKFEAAEAQFRKALEIDKFHRSSQNFLETIDDLNQGIISREYVLQLSQGIAYLVDNRHYEAIDKFRKAIKLNPNYDRAYVARGFAYMVMGSNDKAIDDFNKAIQINPRHAPTYVYRSQANFNMGLYGQAISDYNIAIAVDPGSPLGYAGKGWLYVNMGKFDEAISDYSKAIEINPMFAEAYLNRGYAYIKKGFYNQGASDYDKAIEINPEYAEAYVFRGCAYADIGQYNEAIPDFNKAIKISPEYADAYHFRGIAYAAIGENKRAVSDFKQAITIEPRYAELHGEFVSAHDAKQEEILSQPFFSRYSYQLVSSSVAIVGALVTFLIALFISRVFRLKQPLPVLFVATGCFLKGLLMLIVAYFDFNIPLLPPVVLSISGIFHIYLAISLFSLFNWARVFTLAAVLITSVLALIGAHLSQLFGVGFLSEASFNAFLAVAELAVYYFCLNKKFFEGYYA